MKWVSDATISEIKERKKERCGKGDEGTRSVAKLVSGIVESTAGGLWCDPVKVVVNPGRGGKAYAGAGEKTKSMTGLGFLGTPVPSPHLTLLYWCDCYVANKPALLT